MTSRKKIQQLFGILTLPNPSLESKTSIMILLLSFPFSFFSRPDNPAYTIVEQPQINQLKSIDRGKAGYVLRVPETMTKTC